ncbi:MAG: type II toxin-antitoxin system death-on-curing family toxin [Acidobacteriota bacterium]
MIVTLSVRQLVALHGELLKAFGGRRGLRDRAALESAAARPGMTFDGEDLYPDLAAKVAALMHSLVVNHPFVDGNKRVGAAAAELVVEVNGHHLLTSDSDLENVTLAVARGDLSAEALAIWFRQRL